MPNLLHTMRADHSDQRFYIDGVRVAQATYREASSGRLDTFFTTMRAGRWRHSCCAY